MEMPKTLEDCIRLRIENCKECEFEPKKLGRWTNCRKRIYLKYPEGVPASR